MNKRCSGNYTQPLSGLQYFDSYFRLIAASCLIRKSHIYWQADATKAGRISFKPGEMPERLEMRIHGMGAFKSHNIACNSSQLSTAVLSLPTVPVAGNRDEPVVRPARARAVCPPCGQPMRRCRGAFSSMWALWCWWAAMRRSGKDTTMFRSRFSR